jgi:hypothetical protein
MVRPHRVRLLEYATGQTARVLAKPPEFYRP